MLLEHSLILLPYYSKTILAAKCTTERCGTEMETDNKTICLASGLHQTAGLCERTWLKGPAWQDSQCLFTLVFLVLERLDDYRVCITTV